MRKIFLYSIVLLAGASITSSCTKNIKFDVPNPENLIVVEGSIEPAAENSFLPPIVVFLTHNSPYYGTTQLNDLKALYIKGAIVKVSDGVDTVLLDEISIDTSGVAVTAYVSNGLTPVENRTYYLWVEAEGKKVSAVTTIPKKLPMDSVWIEENVKQTKPELVRLMCRYSDPVEPGNCVRYFTRRVGHELFYLPGFNSVFNDKLINGTTFNFPLDRGVNRNDTSAFDDYGYFFRGDTIEVKWCSIDQATFNFWRTLEYETANNGPFSSPILVQGNITGGLGIWAGYNPDIKTIVAPK